MLFRSEPVLNLKLNSSLKSVPVGDIGSITQNGQQVDSIFVPLYNVGEETSVDKIYGTFIYSGSQQFAIGDKLAIYEGTAPKERVSTEDYTDQQISYVTVTGINGSTISYGNTESSDVVFTPDVLPVNEADDMDGETDNDAITVAIEKMTYSGDDFAAMGLNSSTTIDSGDFIAFYTGSLESAVSLTYAKIIGVTNTGDDYIISYVDVSESDVMSSMNMSSSSDLNYNQISENLNLQDVEAQLAQQVEQSGFAQEAASYLTALVNADEDTRKKVCEDLDIENFSISVQQNDVKLFAATAPKVDVNAHISKNLQHYSGDGMRCVVTVTCDIKLGDDMKLTVSGTFVEEFKVTLSMSSKTIWKKKWIIPDRKSVV